MKKYLFPLLALSLCSLFVFTACSDDEDKNPYLNDSPPPFSMCLHITSPAEKSLLDPNSDPNIVNNEIKVTVEGKDGGKSYSNTYTVLKRHEYNSENWNAAKSKEKKEHGFIVTLQDGKLYMGNWFLRKFIKDETVTIDWGGGIEPDVIVFTLKNYCLLEKITVNGKSIETSDNENISYIKSVE